jgi:hypothetical protein
VREGGEGRRHSSLSFFFSLIDRSKEGFKNLKRRGKKFKIQKSIFCGVKKKLKKSTESRDSTQKRTAQNLLSVHPWIHK